MIRKNVPSISYISKSMIQKKGLFITFEGGEGTGKSTQIKKVADALSQKGIPVKTTREPGGSNVAESIRSIFLQNDLNSTEEMLLILAGRHHHVRTCIRPALEQGQWVLCDRFIDSSLVYQGIHLGHELIMQWHQMAGIHCMPDITFLLQDPDQVMLEKRMHENIQHNRFDQKKKSFHNDIHYSYIDVAKKNPQRYVILPAQKSIDEITLLIMQHIEEKWRKN